MKSAELEMFLKEFKKELYQYSFVLLPDDLQATQIVVDSITLLLADSLDFDNFDSEHVKLSLLENAYQIASKRFEQIVFAQQQDQQSFFKLNFEERAALFLHYRLSLNIRNISYIIKKNEVEVITLLSRSKKRLFDNNSVHFD